MRVRPKFKTVRFSIPEDVIPNGLQIMARDTNNLCKGFLYPKALSPCGVMENDWQIFCDSLAYPVFLDGDVFNSMSMRRSHGFNTEKVLDIAAEWDRHYFRPKGIVMRIDMPGEEKFGLESMDIYHCRIGNKRAHVDNLFQPSMGGDIRRKRPRSKHLKKLKLLARETTRIVLDPSSVLHNLGQAYERGWTNWVRACNDASRVQNEPPEGEMVDSEQSTDAGITSEERVEQGIEVIDFGRITEPDIALKENLRCDVKVVGSKPFGNTVNSDNFSEQVIEVIDSGKPSTTVRTLRWPPSKLLYYDRFRGTETEHVRMWKGDLLVVC